MCDKTLFSNFLDDLGLVYDKEIPVALKRLYWEDLGHLSNDAMGAAVKAHRRDPQRGRFFPRPADLLAKAGMGNCPLTADEAWSIALQSFDERVSVVWTAEIETARAMALGVWREGDKVGARMAFKGAYERAIAAGGVPTWKLSVGHDPEQRIDAVKQAEAAGFITTQQARHLLLPQPKLNPTMAAVAGLITGKVVDTLPPNEQTRQFKKTAETALAQAVSRRQAEETKQAHIRQLQREEMAKKKAAIAAIIKGTQAAKPQAAAQRMQGAIPA